MNRHPMSTSIRSFLYAVLRGTTVYRDRFTSRSPGCTPENCVR